jgi:2-polyprenyl-3-methyl-5-hydroxy-6-metoxy-1,4-benzoquinol methylase
MARRTLQTDPLSDFRVVEISSVMNICGKRVLDIGCGSGEDLVKFKKLGAIVEGFDIDKHAVHFAQHALGLENVAHRNVEDFEMAPIYDVVLMMDLVEHLADPLTVLRKISDSLVEPGLLAIWTPNASFVQQLNDTTVLQFDLEHMQYLTFRTCRYLADVLDLELAHLESVGFADLAERRFASSSQKALLSTWRRILSNVRNPQDMRLGRYHLFCIFANTRRK